MSVDALGSAAQIKLSQIKGVNGSSVLVWESFENPNRAPLSFSNEGWNAKLMILVQ